jgi:hypothetical protein
MALEELGCALAAIEASAPSAAHRLLLVDGALRGLPPHAQAMADRIVAAAGARKLVVLAVAKRSGLEHEGVPLVPLLRRHAPAGCWATEVQPGTFVAHLHPRAATPFRVDAPDIGAVARLAPLCRDAAYPGYPYPLAAAHNAVAITAAQTADLKASLDAAVRRHGGSAAGLLADFHDVLDRNVPG